MLVYRLPITCARANSMLGAFGFAVGNLFAAGNLVDGLFAN